MKRNIAETLLGAVVLVVAAGFLYYFSKTAEIRTSGGYEIKASFSKIDGLEVGSPVKISGIKIGQVVGYELNPTHYTAIVRMDIDKSVELPTDTAAVISSAGLLDGKFMTLIPGADEEMMVSGDMITQTQAAPSLEELLGKYIFSVSKDKESDDSATAAP